MSHVPLHSSELEKNPKNMLNPVKLAFLECDFRLRFDLATTATLRSRRRFSHASQYEQYRETRKKLDKNKDTQKIWVIHIDRLPYRLKDPRSNT